MGTRKSSRTNIPIDERRALTDELKRIIIDRSYGIGIVGVASTDRFEGAPKGHGPNDYIPDANAVIVVGLPIIDGVADHASYLEESEIVKDEDVYVGRDGVTRVYNPKLALRNQINMRSAHESLNMEIQILGIYAGAFLESKGYKTVVIPTTYGTTFSWPTNTNPDFPINIHGFGPFSHRHAAVAAGLGEFGLNNLLLTPQWGPRNRFTSIITRAPLLADPIPGQTICLGEKCSLCIRSCSGQAFGKLFQFDVAGHMNEVAKFDHLKCERGGYSCLKKCISSCPIGAF
jgi:epoxyqueuosine reductase QueG